MALTEEQRKRMEENRKRALEIKRKKALEKERNEKSETNASGNAQSIVFEAGGFVERSSGEMESQGMESPGKKRRVQDESKHGGGDNKNGKEARGEGTRNISDGRKSRSEDAVEDDESSLEDFEVDASPYITQSEAQRTYCVPLGTLAVCPFIEKDNPRHKGWTKMKLYDRAEVRRRARKRFGGKGGLIGEREKRKRKRFEKDLEETKNVFR